MVLDTSLLNTQHYKVWIKGKVQQSRERSSALGVVAIEKGAFGAPSTIVANFTTLHNCLQRIIIIISYLKPYNCFKIWLT